MKITQIDIGRGALLFTLGEAFFVYMAFLALIKGECLRAVVAIRGTAKLARHVQLHIYIIGAALVLE